MKKYQVLVEEYDSQYGEDAYTYFEFFFIFSANKLIKTFFSKKGLKND